ncbi:small nuclear RNA activating complex, subunit SNAP43-domain-containing protein [Paraphysoderma sedebokerense]|nr:small nuclear RNA activating complex, subunit SNAP43-domain-containing protein [Paraphysoderma sedebokerense]
MSTSTASVKADSREQQQQSLEPIVYCGTYGLKISAVSSDIQRLLEAYLSVNTTEFPAFKKIWTDINFSFIHFGCTDKHGREDFMNVVYAITLGQWLSLSDDQDSGSAEVSENVKSLCVRTNIAVIFMLYLLYHTQPDLFPKYLIRTTIGQYKRLTDFLDHLIKDEMEPEHRDAVYVLNLLFKLPAFYVSAWEGGTPPKMIPKRSASGSSRALDLANRQPVLSLFDDVVSWKRNRWVLSQAGEGFMATIRPEVVWELQRKPRGLSSITMGPDDPTLQSLTNEVLGFSVEPSQSLTAPSDSQATSLSLADLAAAYAAHKSLIPESILQPHQKAAMLIPPTKFTDTLYSILSNHQQQKTEVIDLAVKGEPVPIYPPD